MESFAEKAKEQEAVWMKKRNTIMTIAIYIGCVFLAAAIFLVITYFYINRSFNGYVLLREVEGAESGDVQYREYHGNILKYSRDGASAFNAEGESLWNGSYEMNAPASDVCGNYVLIYDVDGRDAMVFNGSDSGTPLTTTLSIVEGRVSVGGVVALLLEDTDSNVINIYNPYDSTETLLAEIPTNVEDGYPVDFALSPDGNSVVTSYMSLSSGIVESKVTFYNFSKVGQDKDRMVGAEDYKDILAPKIEFLDEDRVCIFSGTGLAIWENMKQPSKVAEIPIEGEAKSVFYGKNYIGTVLNRNSTDDNYHLQVYDTKGKRILNREIDFEYDNVVMNGKEILFYGDNGWRIIRINGVEKLRSDLTGPVSAIFPAKKNNRYFLVDESGIQAVKLENQ